MTAPADLFQHIEQTDTSRADTAPSPEQLQQLWLYARRAMDRLEWNTRPEKLKLLFAGTLLYWIASRRAMSASTVGGRALSADTFTSQASTAPSLSRDESYWAADLPEQLTHWADAEERDEVTPQESSRAINEHLRQAGSAGFLILYDLLSQQSRMSVPEACTLLNALGVSKEPVVRKYRTLLISQALKHPSAAVRDRAALTIYDGKVLEAVQFLRAACDAEVLPHVRRSMTDILEALNERDA